MTRSLPTGIVTFLFTDLEGSTRLLATIGERYADILDEHRGVIRDAATARGGFPFGTEGDAMFISFGRASDALMAAVDIQRGLSRHPWPDGINVRVRIGIHAGEVRELDGDYVGLAVHEAARIANAAHGQQTLVSGAARALVGAALPAGLTLRALGEFVLKDIEHPHELFQLEHPDLRSDFPQPRTGRTVPDNLPAQVSSFIGRGSDLARITALLDVGRLITLTGPGGVGKTRLSLEAAGRMRGRSPDGVWFVDLAPRLRDAEVAEAVAEVVGVSRKGDGVIDALVEHLAPCRALFVLDNCEHVTESSAATVRALLRSCAGVSIIATSREPLGVEGETLFPVQPLGATPEEPSAMELFVERARAYDPTFSPTEEEQRWIAEICVRLDGLPLAIELAAPHIRALSVREIAERLDDRFGLLTRGSRSTEERQRTLRAVVDWGYELLPAAERALLVRTAVFSGGFSLQAAEQICSGEGIESGEVYGLLSSLVDRSFVQRSLRAGRSRYFLLETIRAYALEKLWAEPDASPIEAAPVDSLEREGDIWTLVSGGRVTRLKDMKGLRYLAVLLGSPGREFFVLDLVDAVEGGGAEGVALRRAIGDAGEALDEEAVNAYRRRLVDLEEDLDEARRWSDPEGEARIQDEIDKVSAELGRAFGIGGRARPQGSAIERARMSVTKALRAAIARIADAEPELGEALDSAVRTGARLVYRPSGPALKVRA